MTPERLGWAVYLILEAGAAWLPRLRWESQQAVPGRKWLQALNIVRFYEQN